MNIHLHSWNSKAEALLSPSPEKGFRFESIHIHILLKVDSEDKRKFQELLSFLKNTVLCQEPLRTM
jgi:hypothetical protein